MEQAKGTTIPAPGYYTFTGSHGLAPPAGAPWGTACVPIMFQLSAQTPRSLREALRHVVQEGELGGLRVGMLNPDRTWDTSTSAYDPEAASSGRIVLITTDPTVPGPLPDGSPRTMNMGWSTRVSPDGRTEYLTKESVRVYTTAVSDDVSARQAMRFIVAWSQGISGSSTSGTGLAHHLHESADQFSPGDLSAMRAMSGCG